MINRIFDLRNLDEPTRRKVYAYHLRQTHDTPDELSDYEKSNRGYREWVSQQIALVNTGAHRIADPNTNIMWEKKVGSMYKPIGRIEL